MWVLRIENRPVLWLMDTRYPVLNSNGWIPNAVVQETVQRVGGQFPGALDVAFFL